MIRKNVCEILTTKTTLVESCGDYFKIVFYIGANDTIYIYCTSLYGNIMYIGTLC